MYTMEMQKYSLFSKEYFWVAIKDFDELSEAQEFTNEFSSCNNVKCRLVIPLIVYIVGDSK